jgi:hypothetical protein
MSVEPGDQQNEGLERSADFRRRLTEPVPLADVLAGA